MLPTGCSAPPTRIRGVSTVNTFKQLEMSLLIQLVLLLLLLFFVAESSNTNVLLLLTFCVIAEIAFCAFYPKKL